MYVATPDGHLVPKGDLVPRGVAFYVKCPLGRVEADTTLRVNLNHWKKLSLLLSLIACFIKE